MVLSQWRYDVVTFRDIEVAVLTRNRDIDCGIRQVMDKHGKQSRG